MSTLIVGSGLAGLTTAIKLRMENPESKVSILEKAHPESNTQISGMRFRQRISGRNRDPESDIRELLASRNSGIITDPMRLFAKDSIAELQFWAEVGLPKTDSPEWFGPQFGTPNASGEGRGASVLRTLKEKAKELGVTFIQGEAIGINKQGSSIEGIRVQKIAATSGIAELRADTYVLAGGSIGGNMFESTNKHIDFPPQLLAYEAGLNLWNPTLHMLHPFGRSNDQGAAKRGCFETDNLANTEVSFAVSGEKDTTTTDLLRDHKAHYEFPSICRRFLENGGAVVLRDRATGKERHARVSHHYSHLSIQTEGGVKVSGVDNLYAVGDASGLGEVTGHRVRFPGVALTKCLVDAAVVAKLLRREGSGHALTKSQLPDDMLKSEEVPNGLIKANTEGLFGVEFGKNTHEQLAATGMWIDALKPLDSASALVSLSRATSEAFLLKVGLGISEPIIVNQHGVKAEGSLLGTPRGRRL